MIKGKLKIRADSEEHFIQILDDAVASIKRGAKIIEGYYIWPDSKVEWKKEIVSKNDSQKPS